MARGNFGERLKRERELREVSPNEVVVATRISLRFLEALENEDWDKLPGGVFNRGFVRAIARYLGLDEEHLLAEYDLARADLTAESVVSPENRIPSPPKWIAVALVVGAILLIAALVAAGVSGWRRYTAHQRAKQSSALTAPSPAATQVASYWFLRLSTANSFSLSPECNIATELQGRALTRPSSSAASKVEAPAFSRGSGTFRRVVCAPSASTGCLSQIFTHPGRL
jgi:cytoskeletal protein RodZ